MIDVVALGELLIDFTCISTDSDGYPTVAAHPGGAGDIFGGSAVWKLLQLNQAPATLNEEQLRDVVTFACTSAGLSTTRPGGISSVPNYEVVLGRMDF